MLRYAALHGAALRCAALRCTALLLCCAHLASFSTSFTMSGLPVFRMLSTKQASKKSAHHGSARQANQSKQRRESRAGYLTTSRNCSLGQYSQYNDRNSIVTHWAQLSEQERGVLPGVRAKW